MIALEFLERFAAVHLGDDLKSRAEIRFVLAGVELRVDMVRCDIGEPTVWTIDLTNDPATPGRVLTVEEARAAFRPRTMEGAE